MTIANLKEKFGSASTLIKVLIVGALILALVAPIWIYLSWKQGINNEGNTQQQRIVALERAVETELSTCLDSSRLAANITKEEFESIKDILTSVASARYVDADGKSTVAEGTLGGGSFISALQENYPQIDQSSWQRLMDVVVGCRKDVRDDQDRLQLYATEFKTWTQTGGVFGSKIRNNFPNENLEAYDNLAKRNLTGKEALSYLTRVIKTSEATTAIDTGVMPDQDLFNEDK